MSQLSEAVLSQYEKSKAASGTGNRVSNEERMKKYFTTVLPKGVKSDERRIRILPTKDGSTPFVEIKFHEVVVDGKRIKLYDPAQEGKRSPLNEVRESLLQTGLPSDKELAKDYRSRTFYIVKVIDRDHEEDGVKFWRFKYNVKNDGPMDKIFPIFKNKGDITDPQNGRDLLLSLTLTKSGMEKDYTAISSIIPEDPSPLSRDEEQAKAWIDDPLIWSDVYSKKGEDYLDMVARGEVPRWDPDNNKWISATSGEATIGGSSSISLEEIEDPQANEVTDDELPF
jgi:hypothetical protein